MTDGGASGSDTTTRPRPPDGSPPVTGFLPVPPLWVQEDYAPGWGGTHINNPDVTISNDVMCARAVSQGIAVVVARDGFITFGFAEDSAIGAAGNPSEILGERIAVINGFLACLHSAMSEVDRRNAHGDVATHLTVVNARGRGFSTSNPVARALLKLAPDREIHAWSTGGQPHVESTWVPIRHPVSTRAVEAAIDRLQGLLDGGVERLRRYELLLQSGLAYCESNYEQSIIMSGALAEHACRRLWQSESLSIGHAVGTVVKRDAFERLNAADVLSLLRMSGAVSEELYRLLNATRLARNRWVHGLAPITGDEADDAQKAAAWSMALADGLDFIVWPTLEHEGWSF